LALSALTDGLNSLLLPHALLSQAGGDRQASTLGLLSFAGLALAMLIQPPVGALSDRLRPRWGRKGVIAAGLLALLPALALLAVPGFVPLALGYLLAQAAASVAQAAQQGFIPDLIGPNQRGVAAGWKGFMDLAGAMVGFALLGGLLAAGGVRLAALALAALLLAAFALTALLVREPLGAGATAARPNLLAAFRLDLSRHRLFARLVLARFLFLLGTFAVGRFLLLFVADRLGLSPDAAAESAGGLLAVLALVTAVTAPLAGRLADRFGRTPVMVAGTLLNALGTGLLALAASSLSILLFGGLMSLGSAAFAAANWAQTADIVPPEEAARFFGLANIGAAAAAAAAGLFGLLVDSAGFSALFVTAALASLLAAVVLLAPLLRSRAYQPSND
jgi:MFS family permease